jgi:hypothetical protein
MGRDLGRRGREAQTLAELAIARMNDDPMLERLHDRLDDQWAWVLVTDDDAMPLEHADTIARLGTTIATIDGRGREPGPATEQWKWETVHRWAHVMAVQAPGSIRRYSPLAHRLWTPRLR